MYTQKIRACFLLLCFILTILLFQASACAGNAVSGPQGLQPVSRTDRAVVGKKQITIVVSAAADLYYAFQEIGKLFEAKTGDRVTFNFGSTGQLSQQIEHGAPVDVFAAANTSFLDDLVRQGFILPGTKAIYARGFIVIWSRADSPLRYDKIEDLLQPDIRRIAIANPEHAPYGLAAREALQSAGIWDRVLPKLVLGENINQTLQYAETGNVDVAIIALSLAMAVKDGKYIPVPQNMHKPIDQGMAVVKGTRHEREARSFIEMVNGPDGRSVMRQYGFTFQGEELPK